MADDRSDDTKSGRAAADKTEISRRRLRGSSIAAAAVASTAFPGSVSSDTSKTLPTPQPPFQGKIERTLKGSRPDFPKAVEAPAGAPNILLIMTDDVGF